MENLKNSYCEYYDIIISIFFGILFIVLMDQLFEKPRIINIYPQDDKTNH
jgi:hypothetical protein